MAFSFSFVGVGEKTLLIEFADGLFEIDAATVAFFGRKKILSRADRLKEKTFEQFKADADIQMQKANLRRIGKAAQFSQMKQKKLYGIL